MYRWSHVKKIPSEDESRDKNYILLEKEYKRLSESH